MYTLQQQLVIALKDRNFKEAERLITEENLDINEKNLRGETALFYFSENSSLAMMEWLINNGADIDAPSDELETPLMKAVKNNQVKAVDLLVSMGADPNIGNKRKVTPLLQAVLNYEDSGVFNSLMNASPDLNLASETGVTPLLAAVSHGKIQFLDALFDAGADPEVVDILGQGVLIAAVLNFEDETGEIVKKVIERAPHLDPNYAAHSGSTAMSLSLGRPNITKMLLDIGGDPNAKVINKMYNNMTLLMGIASNAGGPFVQTEVNTRDLLEEMISKGADVHAKTDAGHTALASAIRSGSTEGIKLLVNAGADPKRPSNANSVLPYDIISSIKIKEENQQLAIDMINEWHSMGFPFERPEWDEKIDGSWTKKHSDEFAPMPTVLVSYLKNNYIFAIKECLSLGANVNEKNIDGRTIAHEIVISNYNGMSEKLKKQINLVLKSNKLDRTDLENQLKEYTDEAKNNFNDLVSTLNNSNIDWSAQDNNGLTPLHYAASTGNIDFIKFLMQETNADITKVTNKGLNVAAIALMHGKYEAFVAICHESNKRGIDLETKSLVQACSNAPEDFRERQGMVAIIKCHSWSDKAKNATNDDGQTALYVSSGLATHEVVRALVEIGCDTNFTDENGNSALMQAVLIEDGEIIRALRAGGANVNHLNNAKQSVDDVANYVRSKYVFDALSGDISDLLASMQPRKLENMEIVNDKIAKINVENVIRKMDDRPLITISYNEKEDITIEEQFICFTDPENNSKEILYYKDYLPKKVEVEEVNEDVTEEDNVNVVSNLNDQDNDDTFVDLGNLTSSYEKDNEEIAKNSDISVKDNKPKKTRNKKVKAETNDNKEESQVDNKEIDNKEEFKNKVKDLLGSIKKVDTKKSNKNKI